MESSDYPFLLTPAPRRQVIDAFERRLMTEVELEGDKKRPWREIIDRQAYRLRNWMVDPAGSPYRAIRAHG